MAERSIIDQLDDAVTALLAEHEPAVSETDRELTELVALARELRGLPSEQFRAALKEELGGKKEMSTAAKQIEPVPMCQEDPRLHPGGPCRSKQPSVRPRPDGRSPRGRTESV